MLTMLTRLGDATLVEQFIIQIVEPAYNGDENAALHACIPLQRRRPRLFATLVRRHMGDHHGSCVALLHGLAAKSAVTDPKWARALRDIAQAAVTGLDEIAGQTPPSEDPYLEPEREVEPDQSALVTHLFDALATLGVEPLREEAARRLASRPEVFDPVSILVPALGSLCARLGEIARRDSTLLPLWMHSAQFLLARSEVPPESPKNWRQEETLSCRCVDCRELQAFVLRPLEQTHRFRVRKDRRQHLHQQIECHRPQMTHATERRGSPQTLVCTKDRRNYQRRCEQYRQDVAAMAALSELGGSALGARVSLLTRIEGARARAKEWSP